MFGQIGRSKGAKIDGLRKKAVQKVGDIRLVLPGTPSRRSVSISQEMKVDGPKGSNFEPQSERP